MKRLFPLLTCISMMWAQGGGGPLGPPPVPPQNPITAAKANLGKTLFWDEQLSSTNTVACGTCHIPANGGSENRFNQGSIHPGPDGQYMTPDDIMGSFGVPLHTEGGTYLSSDNFGIGEQVTGRKTPTNIHAAYVPRLFWDGRADDTLRDPATNAIVINQGAALENQVLGPPLSNAEMAHVDRDWNQVAQKMASAKPLVLAEDIPAELDSWIDDRDYPELFQAAFGDQQVTPIRIAMAIATYERTLVANQTPFDADRAGNPNALTQPERRGRRVFNQANCNQCHAGPLLTDDNFHYIGVRPQNDDLGRFNVTNNTQDRGKFKTPSLRNVELKAPFFHNGRFENLMDVINFYDRGGDFNAPNKDPRIRNLNLSNQEKNDLLAFLTRPLTDQRVVQETAPFDRPTLYTESSKMPQLSGNGKVGSGGFTPSAFAIEPPLIGTPRFTLAVDETLPGAQAVLVIDHIAPPINQIPATGSFLRQTTTSQGSGQGGGFASINVPIPNDANLQTTQLFARWYITDPGAQGGFSASELISFQPFGPVQNNCASDLNGDGLSDVQDMIVLLDNFGPCTNCNADLNSDGMVDQLDMYILCNQWLNPCP